MRELLERRLIRIPLYGIFALLVFLLALRVTFPEERIKQILIVQIEKNLNAGKTVGGDDKIWEIEIEDLDIWWLSGLEFQGVHFKERWTEGQRQRAEQEAEEGAPPRKPLTLRVPRVAGRASLLQSVANLGAAGVFVVDFDEGGIIEGTFTQGTQGLELHAEIVELDMFRAKVLEGMTGVPGFGTLNGSIDATTDPRGVVQSGEISLRGSKLTVGPATVKTDKLPSMAYLEVPQTNFGNLAVEADITSEGRSPTLVFEEFEAQGRDVRMQLWGELDLGRNPATSRADIDMRLQFNEGFVKENSLAPLLNLKLFRSGKSGDNWYGISFKGLVRSLRPRGSVAAARGPSKARGPKGPKGKGAGAKAPGEPPNSPGKRPRRNVRPKRDK